MSTMPGKPRYIMVGGFLGAGKTTAILQLAQRLSAQGLKVGLITNDQSVGLVDTALLEAQAFPVEEITGGCFCCRFNSLVEAANKLTERLRPDVFIAEPVGSCTDLQATVSYPLRRIYGDDFSIAPLSVLVDPIRALRVLGVEEGKAFSPKVLYVYAKQLEEAQFILINKTDLVSPERLAALKSALRERFGGEVLEISARQGRGMEGWLMRLQQQCQDGPAMQVDYEEYAEGEALLGWLNVTLRQRAEKAVDGNQLLRYLAREVQGQVQAKGVEVAHLKMTLAPEEGADIGVINLVRNDGEPELAYQLQADLAAGTLLINLRAEGDPEGLRASVVQAVEKAARDMRTQLTVEHIEAFRPGRPQPTHRMGVAT